MCLVFSFSYSFVQKCFVSCGTVNMMLDLVKARIRRLRLDRVLLESERLRLSFPSQNVDVEYT